MSSAVFKRLPVAASKLAIYEQVKVYRDAGGAAVHAMETSVTAKPLNKALQAAVQEINFLETETLHPQPVNMKLTNQARDSDPYLSPFIRDLTVAFFGTK